MRKQYIPGNRAKRLNAKAKKNKRSYMAEETPTLIGGFNLPVVGVLPLEGWVRCTVPATPDCREPVSLDLTWEDYYDLPLIEEGRTNG